MAKKIKISVMVTQETLAKIVFLKKLLVPDVVFTRGDVIDYVVGEKYTAMGGIEIKSESGIRAQNWAKNDPNEREKSNG